MSIDEMAESVGGAPDNEPIAVNPASSTDPKVRMELVKSLQGSTLFMSRMADQKASILMGATFVVFSIAMRQALEDGDVPWSLGILAIFSLLSAVFAVLVVLPSTGPKVIPDEHRNDLFFGHFSQIEEVEWKQRLERKIATDDQLFDLWLRDIHQNGTVVQNKKYRFLGLAYRTFLIGLGVTGIAFLVEFFGM